MKFNEQHLPCRSSRNRTAQFNAVNRDHFPPKASLISLRHEDSAVTLFLLSASNESIIEPVPASAMFSNVTVLLVDLLAGSTIFALLYQHLEVHDRKHLIRLRCKVALQ